MKAFRSFSILLTIAILPVMAQVIPGRYIVELDGEPAGSFAARRGHQPHRGDAVFESRAAEIRVQQSNARQAVEQTGAVVTGATHAVSNTLLVRAPQVSAAQLAAIPGVIRVHPVRMFQRSLDHALPLHKVPAAWDLIGGAGNAGLGAKIGIIDTGIDSSHPSFQDPSLVVPSGFPIVNNSSDLAYTNNKIIVARSYNDAGAAPAAKDLEGHGTGVAMVAAGLTSTGPYGLITGVAPKAFLGNYKVFPDPNSGASTDVIIQAVDDAVADGMDVLNLSLGALANVQTVDQDIMVQTIERAVAAGKIVTIAAGNDGPDPITIGSPGTSPHAISVGNMWNDRIFAGSAQVGNSGPALAIPGNGPAPGSAITAPIVDVANFDPTGMACQPLPGGSLSGSTALILRGVCNFSVKINYAQQAGAVAALIYTDQARPDAINMDVAGATLPATMVDYQTGAGIKQQLAGGSVTGTLVFTVGPVAVAANRLNASSSMGPNIDYGIKPDLVAVGTSIYTAKPLANDGSASDGYVVESGTSFSSPMVAGAAALVVAARPGLTAGQYRSLLINGARALNTDNPVNVQQAGAGVLNMVAALQNNATAVPSSISFGIGSGTVDQTRTLTITNVGSAADTFSINASPIGPGVAPVVSSNTVQLNPGQSQDIAVQFTNSGLPPGPYQGYLQIQGTQNQFTAMVPYWYGRASQIPAYLTILNAPTHGAARSQQAIIFRITDPQGVPVTQTPSVTVTDGGGTVLATESLDSQLPGAAGTLVRLGRTASNTVHIEIGGISKDVVITSP